MASVITYAQVIDGFATTISETQIDLLIDIVDEADTCLDANAVSASKQTMLKIYAVRHMLTNMGVEQSGKGAVTSESAPSGASRSYRPPTGGGLASTSYGALLKQLDVYGCVTGLLENNTFASFRSVGRRAE